MKGLSFYNFKKILFDPEKNHFLTLFYVGIVNPYDIEKYLQNNLNIANMFTSGIA